MPTLRSALLTTFAASLLCLAPAAAASAGQVTAQRGDVTAQLSYSADQQSGGYTFGDLKVTRAGSVLYDAVPAPRACKPYSCGPTAGTPGFPPVRVRDLNGDGEPEVLLTAFTGGAHCCLIAEVLELKAGGGGYQAFDRDFGNSGFSLGDLNGDGSPEFTSSDDAFAYRFTAYAFSGRPIQISRYTGAGKFADVTTEFPGRVRRDARAYWGGYLQLRSSRDGTARGQIAPWAADQYRLGKRTNALAVLKREASRGYLGSTPARGRHWVGVLDKFLRKQGY